MTNRYEVEIVRLHDFFVDWFTAVLPNTEEAFAQFGDSMAPSFTIIPPSGQTNSRDEILDRLKNAHGRIPNIRIWIENVEIHQQHGDITIVTYEEWQETEGNITSRLSTVVFKDDAEAPNQLVWLHVHETWLTQD